MPFVVRKNHLLGCLSHVIDGVAALVMVWRGGKVGQQMVCLNLFALIARVLGHTMSSYPCRAFLLCLFSMPHSLRVFIVLLPADIFFAGLVTKHCH